MTIDLKAIRGRAARFPTFSIDHEVDKCADDRVQLLALIDHLMGEIYGIAACAREADVPAHAWNRIEHALNLLRDLDGDARGGGR